jgi:hypothetical protein
MTELDVEITLQRARENIRVLPPFLQLWPKH